jgi:sporulation protein YtfJ
MKENETNTIGSLLETTMDRLHDIVNVDTVVGTPINTPDGITLIPVSRVSYAFASGGSDFRLKDQSNPGFGGGNGAGVKIDPIGFLVVKDGGVRMMSITPPASNTLDRVIEKAPELMDSVEQFLAKRGKAGE